MGNLDFLEERYGNFRRKRNEVAVLPNLWIAYFGKKLIFADSKSVSSFKGIPGSDTTGRRLKISNVCIAPYTSQIAADLSIHEGIKKL